MYSPNTACSSPWLPVSQFTPAVSLTPTTLEKAVTICQVEEDLHRAEGTGGKNTGLIVQQRPMEASLEKTVRRLS